MLYVTQKKLKKKKDWTDFFKMAILEVVRQKTEIVPGALK